MVDHPLPVASDPVVEPEIETAGGPSPDVSENLDDVGLSPDAETTRAAELINVGLGGVEHAHEEIVAREAAAFEPAPAVSTDEDLLAPIEEPAALDEVAPEEAPRCRDARAGEEEETGEGKQGDGRAVRRRRADTSATKGLFVG